jgi:hypothetical protein
MEQRYVLSMTKESVGSLSGIRDDQEVDIFNYFITGRKTQDIKKDVNVGKIVIEINDELFDDKEDPFSVKSILDYFESLFVPIVSKRFIDSLQKAGVNNVEFIPVTIQFKKQKIEGWSIMNIPDMAECMDKEKSKFTEWHKRVAQIESLVLDPKRTPNLHIFRLREDRSLIIVDQRVVDQLKQDNITGYVTFKTEEWKYDYLYS